MAVWYDLIINLRDYLRTQMERPAKIIEAGALNPTEQNLMPDESGLGGAIFLIRSRELHEKLYHGGDGYVVFYVENWVHSDAADLAEGYQLLAAQEEKFNNALIEWAATGCSAMVNVDVLQVEVMRTIGDFTNRPILGSRKTIRVQWSKRTI